jgi:hypothetical protein
VGASSIDEAFFFRLESYRINVTACQCQGSGKVSLQMGVLGVLGVGLHSHIIAFKRVDLHVPTPTSNKQTPNRSQPQHSGLQEPSSCAGQPTSWTDLLYSSKHQLHHRRQSDFPPCDEAKAVTTTAHLIAESCTHRKLLQ